MVDPASQTRKPLSPMFRMAVLAGMKASVELHLRLGNDVNATDDRGRTPLMLAASRGHAELCRLLLAAGADATLIDRDGQDAFQAAVDRGHNDAAAVLRDALTAPSSARADDIDESEFLAGHLAPDLDDTVAPTNSTITSPREESELFELDAWEEETETPPPIADPSCLQEAGALQRKISAHIPIDTDERWEDIPIDLPDREDVASEFAKAVVGGWRDQLLDRHEKRALRRFLLTAVRDGRTQTRLMEVVGPRDNENPDLPDSGFESTLRMVLGDLGVVVDDDPFAPDLDPAAIDDADEDEYGPIASEALSFLLHLGSNGSDPLALFVKVLPRVNLTRDQVNTLGTANEDRWRDAPEVRSVLRMLGIPGDPESLDTEEVWQEVSAIEDTSPTSEEVCAAEETAAIVQRQLDGLSSKVAAVIRMRYGIGFDGEHTLEEVGEKFGLTRERIRQIERKGMEKLAHPARANILRPLLG